MNLKSSSKRLVLFDAHAILHRAYHALPEFSNSRGEPTGALYGLSAMLIKIINDLKPDYMAAAYDLPKPTFRHEAYKDYKAGRAKAEDALISQMKRSREIFEAFHIPIYDKEGFEADDILGTIVEQVVKDKGLSLPAEASAQAGIKDCDVIIASGDMDTLQLVDDKRIQVFTLRKGINDTILYDEEKVNERYGFGPKLLPDYKGLCGDASDNIKGVQGIGEKTATALIKNFGSVENIYKQLKAKNQKLTSTIKLRFVELLEKGKEDADFSKILATIRKDAPIKFALPEKEWKESVDLEKAEKLFQTLEFRTLGERLKESVRILTEGSSVNSDTQDKNTAGQSKPVSKTAGLPEEKSKEEEGVLPAQAALYQSKEEQTGEAQEPAVALWLINSNLTNSTAADVLSFAQTKDLAVARAKILAELRARNLTRVFEEIEKPLIAVVAKMNTVGVKIDSAYLNKLSEEYHGELSALERDIRVLAKETFNINSPKQLGEVIFNKLGLKGARQKKTAGGALSTRESELEKLRDAHPIIGKILEYREFQKLLSTYIDNIPGMADKEGRLHANFLQTGTTTGRMASEQPNLQNIPNHTERGRRIRNAFVAEKGNLLLSLDYSQIELRVAAFMSNDQRLIEIFKNGMDVHAAVASEIFNIPQTKVDKDMRRKAKVINFGILYGMGVNALRGSLSGGGLPVSREEAAQFLDEYFTRFPALAKFLEETKNKAREEGFTKTLFGRRRNFEALNSPIPYIRSAAERQAANAPLQGTAADIIKLAMVNADRFLENEKLGANASLILQVHDELVYEVKKESAKQLALKIKAIMENVLSKKETRGVPIVADASVGENWGSMLRIAD